MILVKSTMHMSKTRDYICVSCRGRRESLWGSTRDPPQQITWPLQRWMDLHRSSWHPSWGHSVHPRTQLQESSALHRRLFHQRQKIGGYTPSQATACHKCVSKLEETELARVEHGKLHMHQDLLWNQLLDTIHTPLLDRSIMTAILECGQCKNFSTMHLHSLLAPITRRRPFELLVGDYLSMPTGKGSFSKIGLYADVFTQKLWGFKSKTTTGKDTINSLRQILQAFVALTTSITDGGPHFNCDEVHTFCNEIGTCLHVIAAYSLWINGLLKWSNGILLDTLKWLCAPNLGEDEYKEMQAKDLPKNWPDYLDLPSKFCIECNIIRDPLANVPILPPILPPFSPHSCYTDEQHNKMDDLHPLGFLWPIEHNLLHHFMTLQIGRASCRERVLMPV